jgi:hypothetical protein
MGGRDDGQSLASPASSAGRASAQRHIPYVAVAGIKVVATCAAGLVVMLAGVVLALAPAFLRWLG